jgi:heterodisulfide reductase subunit B
LKTELQQDYRNSLQEKSTAEEKDEMILKEKSEVEEKDERILKEKDEVEQQVEKIQQAIQKLYKDILEIPMVVEATLEEQVSKIREVIKGFAPGSKTWNRAPHQGHHLRKRKKEKEPL